MKKIYDGITSLTNSLMNRRKASATNVITTDRISDSELRAAFITGVMSKVIKLKTGYALNDTLQFVDTSSKEFYDNVLAKHIKKVAKYQLGFGRGLIVIAEKGADLSTPMREVPDKYTLQTFSGDVVTVGEIDRNLNSENYYKPKTYNVYGSVIHHTRVVDFTYVEPTEVDMPTYRYGGVSETELVYNQLINAGIVENASAAIIEKNSTIFYKVKDFKSMMQSKKESQLVEYFSRIEDARSVYGAGLLDAEDNIESVNQALTNLMDVDTISLRRLAMVTGIPLALLVGENVKGLNSSGKEERVAFQDTIENYQSDYILDNINELLRKLGKEQVQFKDNQGSTPESRIEYETKAIDNAVKLSTIGEDYEAYLEEKGIVLKDDIASFFKELGEDNEL
jgi:hypothetical protein